MNAKKQYISMLARAEPIDAARELHVPTLYQHPAGWEKAPGRLLEKLGGSCAPAEHNSSRIFTIFTWNGAPVARRIFKTHCLCGCLAIFSRSEGRDARVGMTEAASVRGSSTSGRELGACCLLGCTLLAATPRASAVWPASVVPSGLQRIYAAERAPPEEGELEV